MTLKTRCLTPLSLQEVRCHLEQGEGLQIDHNHTATVGQNKALEYKSVAKNRGESSAVIPG